MSDLSKLAPLILQTSAAKILILLEFAHIALAGFAIYVVYAIAKRRL